MSKVFNPLTPPFDEIGSIDRLTSITSTPGATLIFTSDGVNTLLTNSLGGLELTAPGDITLRPTVGGYTTTIGALAMYATGNMVTSYLSAENATVTQNWSFPNASGTIWLDPLASGLGGYLSTADDPILTWQPGNSPGGFRVYSGVIAPKYFTISQDNTTGLVTFATSSGTWSFATAVAVTGTLSASGAVSFTSANPNNFTASVNPTVDATPSLGVAGGTPKRWLNLFLSAAGTVNWGSGSLVLTGGTNKITLSGSSANGNSLVLAAGGTSLAPLQFQTGALLTTAVAGGFEYLTNTIYASPSASNRGIVPATHFASNVGDFTMTYSGGAGFPWLQAANDTITLIANTTYFFEGLIKMTHGTTTHTTSTLFGGTVTIGSILYQTEIWTGTDDAISTGYSAKTTTVGTASVINATAGTAATVIKIKGIMRVTTAGTLIPQIAMSADPTGTILCKTNSYFKIWAAGSNTNAATGNWA